MASVISRCKNNDIENDELKISSYYLLVPNLNLIVFHEIGSVLQI